MSVGITLIVLAILLRSAGRFVPFYAFKERILITRIVPLIIFFILLGVHLVHSHFTLSGIYVMIQMFPEFLLLILFGVVYVLYVSYRIARIYLLSRKLAEEVLGKAYRVGDVYVLPVKDLVALNVGFLRPRIVVSEGVLSLPENERELVMEHERFHARMRDNLRLLLFELLLPTEKDREDYRAYLEIRNDSHMLKRYTPRDLAYTLVRFSMAYPGGTGMATSLRRRIEFLSGEMRIFNLKGSEILVIVLTPLIWYLAYTSCYMDLCIK